MSETTSNSGSPDAAAFERGPGDPGRDSPRSDGPGYDGSAGSEDDSTAARAPIHSDEPSDASESGIARRRQEGFSVDTTETERFPNPGLPPHVHRMADSDPRAARRAERQVVSMFLLSMLGTAIFLVAYFVIKTNVQVFIPGIGNANLQNVVLGLSLAAGLFFIGTGAVHWAKTLMPDVEVAEARHPQRSSDADRAGAVANIMAGGEVAQINRRPLIKYTLGGALGLFALPLVLQVAGSLGPLPGDDLSKTFWKKGMRLMRDPDMTPIKASDVTIGSVFHIQPEGIAKLSDALEQEGKAAVLLMRLDPSDLKVAKARDWGYQGIVAYSKICTHVGCPVGLYEQQTHHLLCPCHQSTFDVTEDCKVIFGPAGRPLPQLKITVDNEGYLIADSAFREAVGPSFWERGHA